MPKICILDARTLGDDIDLNVFNEFGEVIVYDITAPENVVERIKDCEIVITNKVVLNSTNLQEAVKVKLICVAATGTNNIDLEYAGNKGITVTNVAGYSTNSVVQHTFTMLFYLLGSPAYYDSYVKSGQYAESKIFTHLDAPFPNPWKDLGDYRPWDNWPGGARCSPAVWLPGYHFILLPGRTVTQILPELT